MKGWNGPGLAKDAIELTTLLPFFGFCLGCHNNEGPEGAKESQRYLKVAQRCRRTCLRDKAESYTHLSQSFHGENIKDKFDLIRKSL